MFVLVSSLSVAPGYPPDDVPVAVPFPWVPFPVPEQVPDPDPAEVLPLVAAGAGPTGQQPLLPADEAEAVPCQ